ncbi:MAG: hypothetical protein HN576_14555 [Bacteriovoracaceae bacterium]|jgi:hypothetical protein|nr:hypothetical protein [Bacteriovoracaceae bacterium]
MKRIIYKFLLIIMIFVFYQKSFALELDEKLTTRLIKVSKTKKTVLLNRGLEDGLVVGDHAKFFLTTGVVARGVVVKSSPTRSIWSVYRIIEKDALYKNKVVNIKITKGMQVTDDQTRSMIADKKGNIDLPQSIVLAPGANDLGPEDNMTDDDKNDMNSISDGDSPAIETGYGITNQSFEVWGLLNFNNMSVSSDLTNGEQTSGGVTALDFTMGLEKYFNTKSSFLRHASLQVFFHQSTQDAVNLSGIQIGLSAFSYGGAANYHFKDPFMFGKLIPFLTMGFGLGSSQDSIEFNSSTITTSADILEGSSNFISFGVGGKFYLKNGFGARAILDYYQRGEIYSIDDGSEYTKTVSGLRVQMGLSYRF